MQQGRKLSDNLIKYARFVLVSFAAFVLTFLGAAVLNIRCRAASHLGPAALHPLDRERTVRRRDRAGSDESRD